MPSFFSEDAIKMPRDAEDGQTSTKSHGSKPGHVPHDVENGFGLWPRSEVPTNARPPAARWQLQLWRRYFTTSELVGYTTNTSSSKLQCSEVVTSARRLGGGGVAREGTSHVGLQNSPQSSKKMKSSWSERRSQFPKACL